MTQFTYLLGAGASAKSIPVVNDFVKSLKNFSEYLERFTIMEDTYDKAYKIDTKPSDIIIPFTKSVEWLAEECGNHSSVDTFARKLYLANRQKELIILKTVVSEFLLYQHMKNGIDNRYDAFFAALLSKSESSDLVLPDNIKILSWNYDKQIEYSIAQFHNIYQNEYIENFLQVSPRYEGTAIDPKCFCLFKLNGTIGGTIQNNGKYIPLYMEYNLIGKNITDEIEQLIIKNILFRYQFIENRIKLLGRYNSETPLDDYPTILYSWERNTVFDFVRNNALDSTKETDILVIIGYSFPTFNRELDKKLLKNMSSLKKVFIQSPESSIKGVMQRFKSLNESDVHVEPITNVEEFYIPFEF